MSTRPNETAPEHQPDPAAEDRVSENPAAEAAPDEGPAAENRANLMWGGRFSCVPAEAMARINASIEVDLRLYSQDIAASKAN